MTDTNSQPSQRPALPDDIARRMQAIIDRHAQEYRHDLPKLIGCMRAHAGQMHDIDMWREAMPLLKREAHDMKGQAATFGFPSLSAVSQSLCRLLDHGDRDHPDFPGVIDLHVSAIERLLDHDDQALVDRVKTETTRLTIKAAGL
jgi:chemotaxis protein histidine kinase CheA